MFQREFVIEKLASSPVVSLLCHCYTSDFLPISFMQSECGSMYCLLSLTVSDLFTLCLLVPIINGGPYPSAVPTNSQLRVPLDLSAQGRGKDFLIMHWGFEINQSFLERCFVHETATTIQATVVFIRLLLLFV